MDWVFRFRFLTIDPMSVQLWGVDAFTCEPFRGNPAAVCVSETPLEPALMQSLAAELNVSETAFLVPQADMWGLRWFTPTVEVALCGHATLASAHVLWESGKVPFHQTIRFQTQWSGILLCRRSPEGISMDFPACPAVEEKVPPGLEKALGAGIIWLGRSKYDFLCELADEDVVRGLQPDLQALSTFPVRGVIVTARGSRGLDCVSRFFGPAVGVPEDPVTGSAHCTLAPFWAERLGRTRLRGWQASKRGGEVGMEFDGHGVVLTGSAVTVWKGTAL